MADFVVEYLKKILEELFIYEKKIPEKFLKGFSEEFLKIKIPVRFSDKKNGGTSEKKNQVFQKFLKEPL